MATIEIINDVEEIEIGEQFSLEFNVVLEATESLDSVEIVPEYNDPGVSVQSNIVSGSFSEDTFQPDPNSITYLEDGLIKTADDWDSLPEPSSIDIVEWNAPETIIKDIGYTVTALVTDSMTMEQTEVTDIFPITLYGSYSVWAEQLRNYT